MPQSLAQLLVHIVFSTKHRVPILGDEIRDELHAYIGGTITHHRGALLKAGSVADHIHLLAAHPRTLTPAELVQEIKVGSSKWIKTRGQPYARFAWQSGYGMFAISPSHRVPLERYIANQADHHRRESFQDEFRRLLQKNDLEWDERYVWE